MGCDMRACVVIPARFASSRFPGKPLIDLVGKPMIQWVAEAAAVAVGRENVFVATEDRRVYDAVLAFGGRALMTSSTCLTGTDRLAEAADQLDYDIIVNVQGDEPLVDPGDIATCIERKKSHPGIIQNGYAPLAEGEDPHNVNIPKVIMTETGRMVYMSRAALPASKTKDTAPDVFYKQVCIYGFSKDELSAFAGFGRKGNLEKHEDIEILRFLELDREIHMFRTQPGSLAVDVPDDIDAVVIKLKRRNSE